MFRGKFAEQVRGYCESITTVLLLPLFFVFSGLNTKVNLLDSLYLWGVTTLIVFAAIAGNGFGCMFAARLAKSSWEDAAVIGTLMNARGVMELIIFNIGLQAGIITPTLFTMIIIMAIVTTLMASPLFYLVTRNHLAMERR